MAKMYYEKACDLRYLDGRKIAIIGEESKDDALERLLREFGILELVRTGMVALERGRATISDNADNKETDEFELGKNVL